MPSTNDTAGYDLIKTGTLLEFEVTSTKVEPSPDGESSHVRIEIQLGGPEGGEGEEQAEWGAFGFMFVLATLSFHDARPRGHSDIDFVDGDEFTVADFFEGLRFVRGELHLGADYVRGRCVKTDITVRRDGRVTLETRGRGEGASHWLERLQGKRKLALVT